MIKYYLPRQTLLNYTQYRGDRGGWSQGAGTKTLWQRGVINTSTFTEKRGPSVKKNGKCQKVLIFWGPRPTKPTHKVKTRCVELYRAHLPGGKMFLLTRDTSLNTRDIFSIIFRRVLFTFYVFRFLLRDLSCCFSKRHRHLSGSRGV